MTASPTLVINHSLDVIRAEDSDKVLLKDFRTGALKLIGKREWGILQSFSDGKLETLFSSFRREYVERVIEKGVEMNILVSADADFAVDEAPVTFKEKVRHGLLKLTNQVIYLECAGNFNLFKVFTIRLRKGNWFESLSFKKVAAFYLTVLAGLLLLNFLSPMHLDKVFFNVTSHVTYQITLFIILVFFSSYLFATFHEMGHFIVYKALGGQSNVIGFGLKFLAMPVLFVNTDTVYLWEERWKRVLVTLGGCIVDFTWAGCIVVFIKYGHHAYPNLAFMGYMVLISIAIKSFFNLNFFMPGTDGYFIMTDLIGKTNYYKTVQADKDVLVTAIRTFKFTEVSAFTRGNWFNIGYFAVAFVFKCISIFLSIWSFFYIGKMMMS